MSLSRHILKEIRRRDEQCGGKGSTIVLPAYDPERHYLDLAHSEYYYVLLEFRHILKLVINDFFSEKKGATDVDLFMLTPSVSSPMGSGSDSEPVSFKFGNHNMYLTDSAQFGFEPLLLQPRAKMVYCYMPSMRGEDADARHLNQFFHCELEMVGCLADVQMLVEELLQDLALAVSRMPRIVHRLSANPKKSLRMSRALGRAEKLRSLAFDEAVELLRKNKSESSIRTFENGIDITSEGEKKLLHILKDNKPVWLHHYHRDRVPFYQRPDPDNHDRVLNADLLFPPLIPGGFGGEIVGCGERQDSAKDLRISLERQGVSADPYEWYINLRSQPGYRITSGFGLGVERFIAWILGRENIRDVIPYPRLKNTRTYP